MNEAPYDLKIYKSSAGSGKTFTLVKEYLRIVLAKPSEYKHILALTFTNKAATEMKERILSALTELARGEAEKYRAKLVAENNGDPETITENAKIALSNILHDYVNFSLSTLDAFTHRIVRNFAHDMELSSGFDVETDQSNLTGRMVSLLLDLVGKEPYITRMLIEFAQERLAQEADWKIDRSLEKTAGLLFKEDSEIPIRSLHAIGEEKFPEFISWIRQKRDFYIDNVRAMAERALELIHQAGLSIEDFLGAKNSCASVFEKILKPISPGEYLKLIGEGRFMAAVTEDKWYAQKADSTRMDAVLDGGLRELARELYQFHLDHFRDFVTAWYASANIHGLAVIKRVESLMEEYKADNNLLHISDFQKKVSDFITNESPDYLYWRLGERYRHFLLDEFQDTSAIQWKNLLPLLDHLLSGGHPEGSILLVGDSRQAIYRWRGGELDLLEYHAPEHLQTPPLLLDTNYRSGGAIVEFNNLFFEESTNLLRQHSLLKSIYSGGGQKTKEGFDAKGYVRAEILDKDLGTRDQAMQRTLEIIREAVQDGYALREIAVLVRTKDEGSDLANFLMDEGVTVISSDSLLLYKNPQVAFLVNLMRIIADPADKISRAAANYFLLQLSGKKEEVIDGEVLPPQFFSIVKNPARFSLYDLTEELVRMFRLHIGAPAFLQRFLDVVLEYSNRNLPSIPGFLEWWEERKFNFSLVIPKGENAVEILTIHKSKGLQFPIVILPFVTWSIKPKSDNLIWARAEHGNADYPDNFLVPSQEGLGQTDFAAEWELEKERTVVDNVNLMYVAFTRAEERMYMLSTANLQRAADPDRIQTAGDLLRCVLSNEIFGSTDPNLYESGIPTRGKRQVEEPMPTITAFPSLPWRNRIRIEQASRKLWNEEEETQVPEPQMFAEALNRMDSAKQLKKAISQLVQSGYLPLTHSEIFFESWSALLQSPPLSEWFAEGIQCKRKAPFAKPDGELWTVDRMMVDDHKLTMVQFCLDKEKKSALKILAQTELALKSAGYASIEKFIYLTDQKRAVKTD